MTVLSLHDAGPAWGDDDVLAHAEQVALARTQSRQVAARVARLPLPQARSFVRRLWEHAGSLGPATPELLVEPPLAGDVQALLGRLGLACELVPDDGQVRVRLVGDDRLRFLREVALARASESAFAASGGPR